MAPYLKITVGFLLLLQGFHMALLQDSTDSPGRTIDKTWLRELLKKNYQTLPENQADADQSGMESSYNANLADNASTTIDSAEWEATYNQQRDSITSSGDGEIIVNTTMVPIFSYETVTDPDVPVTTVLQPLSTTTPENKSQINETIEVEESQNTTTHLMNATALPTTESTNVSYTSPNNNNTQALPPVTDPESWVTNIPNTTYLTTTEVPENQSSTAFPTTEVPSPETSTVQNVNENTTSLAPNTPDFFNITNNGTASGSSSERGLAIDKKKRSKRSEAWGAILVTAVAVTVVGIAIYVILKRKGQRDFTHRKLVEEFPSDPVLRLDNSEPLDLKFDGSAYYNRGLQMDDIQMTNFPN